MNRRQLIIDTDPGIDDAVAILVAISSLADFDLRAIIAIAGNVPINRAYTNARKVCALAGRPDIPIYAGCSRPMRRPLLTGEDVHGQGGLGRIVLPEPTGVVTNENGVEFLIRTLDAADDGSITIATLGPVTNLGTAFIVAPHVVKSVREVVMMGGAFSELGNITDWAEYNVYADPEATAAVLYSGVPVTMVPLDVTHSALTTKARIERLAQLHTRCGMVATEMLRYYEQSAAGRFRGGGAPLHDPCVIAYLACPQLFSGRSIGISIDTTDGVTAGKTMENTVSHPSGSVGRVQCLTTVDAESYFDFVADGLARLP